MATNSQIAFNPQGKTVVVGAGNGCSMTNFYIRNFVTTGPVVGGSALMHISNGRVASVADTTVLSGADVQFRQRRVFRAGLSGQCARLPVDELYLWRGHYGKTRPIVSTTCLTRRSIPTRPYGPRRAQHPPTVGNGTLTGWFTRQGYTCTVSLRLVVGSTSTMGDAASAYKFSLPFKGHQSVNQRGLICSLYDASTTTDYILNATIGANQDVFTLGRNGQGMRLGVPVTLAEGDTIDGEFTYMVR